MDNRYRGNSKEIAKLVHQYLMSNIAEEQIFLAYAYIMKFKQAMQIPLE